MLDDPKSYHHGNLKQALLDGFLELLQHTPCDKLSLRKLASHVGVAPTAVYNHFKNKDELAVAVKAQCLLHFGDYLSEQTVSLEDPEQRIRQLGRAYFYYSREHSTIFDFIMNHNVSDDVVTEELINASMHAESALRDSVKHLLEYHSIPSTTYNEGLGSFACWSLAHGISTLATKRVNNAACAVGRWPPEMMLDTPEHVDATFDAIMSILVAGILTEAQK